MRMTRARLARMLVAGVLAISAVSTIAIVSPVPATANHGGLRSVWARHVFNDDTGLNEVHGVIANDSAKTYENVIVTVTFYGDPAPKVVKGATKLHLLTPHATTSYLLTFAGSVPAGQYVAVASGTITSKHAAQPLRVTVGSYPIDSGGLAHITGTVENLGPASVTMARVMAELWHASGVQLVAAASTSPSSIAAGGTAPFDIVFDCSLYSCSYDRLVIQAEASVGASWALSWDAYFADLGGSSFRKDVIWLGESGITSGCAPGVFCPTDSVTRGQMAAFLERALDLPATGTDYFTDDEASTFETEINRLAAAGITTGCATNRFCPNDPVTREQMASFLARALDLPATGTDYFTDDNASIHQANINRLAASGITKGCTATTFCPKGLVTRGQMAAFIHRALY